MKKSKDYQSQDLQTRPTSGNFEAMNLGASVLTSDAGNLQDNGQNVRRKVSCYNLEFPDHACVQPSQAKILNHDLADEQATEVDSSVSMRRSRTGPRSMMGTIAPDSLEPMERYVLLCCKFLYTVIALNEY